MRWCPAPRGRSQSWECVSVCAGFSALVTRTAAALGRVGIGPRALPTVALCLLLLFLFAPVPLAQGQFDSWTPANLLLTASSRPEASQEKRELRQLRLNETAEHTIAGRECQPYEVALEHGQFAQAIVDQRARDLSVKILGPDGREEEIDGRWHGPEPVSLIASIGGLHRFEVCSVLASSSRDRYGVTLVAVRPPAPDDEQRIRAERLATEGKKLIGKGMASSFQAAIEAYQQALPIWRLVGDRHGEAQTLNSLGFVLVAVGMVEKALVPYEGALAIWQQISYPRGEAETVLNIGAAYSRMGQKRRALAEYGRSLEIRERIGDRYGELYSLNNLGTIYFDLGEPRRALDYFDRVLVRAGPLGDRSMEIWALNNIGAALDYLGETEAALKSYDRALALCRELKNRRSKAVTLVNSGTLRRRMGLPDQAMAHFVEGLEDATAAGDPRVRALTLQNIGLLWQERGEPDKARGHYDQALGILQAIPDRRSEGILRLQIGELLREQDAPEQALASIQAGLSLIEPAGDIRSEAQAHHGSGLIHQRRGDLEAAGESLSRALSLARAAQDHHYEAQVLLSMARLDRDRGALSSARANAERAIELVESWRGRLSSRRLRTFFLASRQQFYECYIDVLMQSHWRDPGAGFDRLAFEASERSRARSFLDLVSESGVAPGADDEADAALLKRQRDLRELLSAKAERHTLLGGRKEAARESAELAREIDDVIVRLEQVEAELRRQGGRHGGLTAPAKLNASDIQAAILDEDTIVLEYALGDERSYLWIITREKVTAVTLPARSRIEAAGRLVYDLLTARARRPRGETASARSRRIARADASYRSAVQDLSDAVLRPAAPHVRTRRLVVVADGVLHYVPFAVLPNPNAPDGRPLVLDHEVVNLPSLSSLAAQRDDIRHRSRQTRQDVTVAVLADPVFDHTDSRVARSGAVQDKHGDGRDVTEAMGYLERSVADLSDADSPLELFRLHGTRREADIIASLVPPGHRFIALDFDANRETVAGLSSDYRYLHFATHGFINTVHPELSGLVLSLVDSEGRPRDGFLRAYEIFNLRLGAELVVLSACRTGLGREVRGEGLIGLSRAFTYAGAARVAVSLWRIDDDGTAQLMEHFYKAMLRNGEPPVAALRKAQMAMLKSERWRAPFYWAAFVIQGDWRN